MSISSEKKNSQENLVIYCFYMNLSPSEYQVKLTCI